MDISQPLDSLSLAKEIRQVLALRLDESLLSMASDMPLREALGDRYDSLTATECIYAIEDRFGLEVNFTTDDVRFWFSTIDRMTRFVAERLEDAQVRHA